MNSSVERWVRLLTTIVVVFFVASEMMSNPEFNPNSMGDGNKSVVYQSSTQNDSLYQTGKRLVHMWGCYDGCHAGETLTSYHMALSLTNIIQSYSISDLKTVIREGKRPSGLEIPAMPPSMFKFIKDKDLEAILTFLKNVQEKEAE